MMTYKPNLLELKKLVFGATGVVYLDSLAVNQYFLEELESITKSKIIDGYLFRAPSMKDYKEEDWELMYAQYTCTYGYPTEEQLNLFYNTLVESNIDAEVMSLHKKDAETSSPKVTIEPESKLQSYINSICGSLIPLRHNQLEMLYATPIEMLVAAFDQSKFVIKETKNIVLTIIFQNGSKELSLFKNLDDIVRFVVANYGYDRNRQTPVESTKLDKTILSRIDLKIPTSIKKVLLNQINNIKINDIQKAQLKKYQQFWKRIFQQLAYTSEKRMTNRFPNAFATKEILYGKTIHTDNSDIEYFRRNGDLATAMSIELGNPGQLCRKLLSYIRYRTNMKYASNSILPTVCVDDVKEIISDTMFDSALFRASPKLLIKIIELLRTPDMLEDQKHRKVNGKVRSYNSSPLPKVDDELALIVIEKIEKVLKALKQEDNKSLGKVYLDLSTAKLPVQFSGRLDTTSSISGAYYPSGSELNLKAMIDEKCKKNGITTDKIIIRTGLAWRGPNSTDLDLSSQFVLANDTSKQVYYPYHANKLVIDDETVSISTGDITWCKIETFSAELIDTSYALVKKHGIKNMISMFNTYSGSKASQLEAYFFLEIINSDDFLDKEVVKKRTNTVNYNLSNSTFAVRANNDTGLFLGLSINFETDKVTILCKNGESNFAQNINSASIQKAISSVKQTCVYVDEILNLTIEPEQFVTEISDADTVITSNQFLKEIEGKTVMNLSTSAEECQKLYM